MKKLNAVLMLGLLVLFSCSKDNNPEPLPDPAPYLITFPDTTVDVYVAGSDTNSNGISVAKYWKNGITAKLTDGIYQACANSIAISGNDIFVSGFENNAAGISVAKYWKNGIEVALSDGTKDAYAKSIAVVGGDVFVSGWDGTEAKCWKNNIPVNLPNGSQGAEIAIMGNNVYIAGGQYLTKHIVPKCWKNGVEYPLNDTTDSECFASKVSGNDIYLAGYQAPEFGKVLPKYWKNGNAFMVDTLNAVATGIDIIGNDIYISGYEDFYNINTGTLPSAAGYWKNGIYTRLSDNASAACIAKMGSYLYVGGFKNGKATLWINNQVFFMTAQGGGIGDVKVIKK